MKMLITIIFEDMRLFLKTIFIPLASMLSVLLELTEYIFTIYWLWLLQDSFYRGLTAKELEDVHEYNFDHPGKFL